MKLKPLRDQYAATLPFYTDLFSEIVTITSLTRSGSVATAVTSTPHGLVSGNTVNVTGAIELVNVTSLVATSSTEMIGRTSEPNGLSMALNFKNLTTDLTVDIIGADQPALNGEFQLLSVPNRLAFTANIPNSGDGSGPIQLYNYAYNYYNGLKVVTGTPTSASFTYDINENSALEATGDMKAHVKLRMGIAATAERAINYYTKQDQDEYFLILVAGTSTANKDRNILNDSVTTVTQTQSIRQRLIENYNVLIFAPTSDDGSAAQTIDMIEDVKIGLIRAMVRFPNSTPYNAETDYVYTYNSGQILQYDSPFLIYQFTFDTVFDITYNDMWNNGLYAPFLDINQEQLYNDQSLTANIDLDIDPDF